MKQTTAAGFTRLSKPAARRAYNAGETIRFCPVKINPCNVWGLFADMHAGRYNAVASDGFNTTVSRRNDFDGLCNTFAAYNCNAETGRYIAFYKGV